MCTVTTTPRAILSEVASLLIQKPTQEMMTRRLLGTYTLMRKYPMWRRSLKLAHSMENVPVEAASIFRGLIVLYEMTFDEK